MFRLISGFAAAVLSLSAHAYPGESIVQDANGDYIITYKSGDDSETELMTTKFVPSTKIVPSIRSGFRLDEHGNVDYRYVVSNGATARQDIVGVLLEQILNPVVGEQPQPPAIPSTTVSDVMSWSATISAATPAPNGWYGDIIRDMSRVAWMPKSGTLRINGIKPGHTLTGFGFASHDLPGISTAKMDGLGAVFGYPDDGPAEDSAILDQLNRLTHNDFIEKPAAVPMIAVPAPFSAATLLGSIQTQMHTWIGMNLLDASFSAQLDQYFEAAINAYKQNHLKAARDNIEEIHKMLMIEHRDLDRENENADEHDHDKDAKRPLIDRLAARVLDFDLKFVLKQQSERDKD